MAGVKVMHGSARANQRSNSLEMPHSHQKWQKGPHTRVKCINGVKGLARVNWGQPEVKLLRNAIWLPGVIRVQPEGNCLEMRRAIKCRQICYRAYAAAGALVIFYTNVYFGQTSIPYILVDLWLISICRVVCDKINPTRSPLFCRAMCDIYLCQSV